MRLTGQQNAVLRDIVAWRQAGGSEFYLAGYAGTGKSTVVDAVLDELSNHKLLSRDRVRTGTYTGKAADVLRRKGVDGAQTIHSMIYTPTQDPQTGETTFEINPDGPAANADLIVLDEVSMVPEAMAADLRSFGKPLLVIGDPGQLPPVKGQGGFTSREPDAFLSEIHRQAAESPIIRLATAARQGDPIQFGDYGDGVRVVPYDGDAGQYVYDEGAQVICGIHRHRIGLTQRIRRARGFGGPEPQVGERIMICRNDREKGIFNGQLGWLAEPMTRSRDLPDGREAVVRLDDRDAKMSLTVDPYLFRAHFAERSAAQKPPSGVKVHHVDWGYVLTCHKAQGSQWQRVTALDDSRSFRDDARRWLYTAITRAESELTIIKR